MNPFPNHALGNTPRLHTKRLQLRPITPEDAPAILALRGDPDNFKYVDFEPYKDLARAERFITNVLKDMAQNNVHFWAICPLESDSAIEQNSQQGLAQNQLIGTICLWEYAENPVRAELGYEIMKPYQGQGLAGEAIAEIIHLAIDSFHIEQLLAVTHRDNAPSVALLHRFGFHRIGAMLELDPNCGETPEMDLYTLVSQHAFKGY